LARQTGKIWLTADALAKRLKSGTGSVVELAANEFLTPNAIDLADMRHVAVKRAAAPGIAAAKRNPQDEGTVAKGQGESKDSHGRRPSTSSPRPSILGLVLDRPTPLVRSLVDQLCRAGEPLADYTMDGCWIRNTRSLCAAVASGELAGGVIIRPWAAEAVMLANKVRGVRAVHGASPAAVSAAIRRFRANLLVVEHETSTLFQMRSLVLAFAAGRAAQDAPNPLLAAVEELERS